MSERTIRPVPKPVSTKKAKGGQRAAPKDGQRAEINNANRKFGRKVEQAVAKMTGGDRTPLSGAAKQSNRNLTGDVEVEDALGRPMLKIECKGTAGITPSGEKTFTLKKSVLDQMVEEADAASEIGCVWLHWKNGEYGKDDYVIVASRHFLQLLEWAKVGRGVERS